MIVGVTLALSVAAIVVLWKQRWPWFLVGTVLMAIGESVSLPIPSAAATNPFEFILLAPLLATKRHPDRIAEREIAAVDAVRARKPAPAWG